MDNKYKHKSGALKSKERAKKLVAMQKITKIDRFLCRPIANDTDVGERKVLSADSSCTDENNTVLLCPKVHANPLANSLEIHCKETGVFRQVFTPPQQKLAFSYHELNAAYCEPCWLFADRSHKSYNVAWIQGIRTWQTLSNKIIKPEGAECHVLQCL